MVIPPDLEAAIDATMEDAVLDRYLADLLTAPSSPALAREFDRIFGPLPPESEEEYERPKVGVFRWNPDTWEVEATERLAIWHEEDLWEEDLAEVLEEGRYVRMASGSLWEVAPEDRTTVRGWLPRDQVGLWQEECHDTPPLYPWCIDNADVDENVWAALVRW